MNLYNIVLDKVKKEGMSMPEFAEEIEVSYSALRNLKYRQVSKPLLKKISTSLKLKYRDLERLNKELPKAKVKKKEP